MFATLGNIEFNLHTSPTADSDTLEIPWVEHELINQPQQLQPAGRNLVEKELEMFFHASFCKVEERVKELKDAAQNYDVMALLMGNGKLIGDFVITNIVTKTDQADELGNRIAVTLSVTLKEYVSDKLQNEQKKAEKNAFATGNKKAVSNNKKPAPYNSCKGYISSYTSKLRMYQSKEQNEFNKYTQLTGSGKVSVAWNVRDAILNVKKNTDEIYNTHPDCINEYQMGPNAANLIQVCNDFYLAMNGIDYLQQTRLHQSFNTIITTIISKATSANSNTATRKP